MPCAAREEPRSAQEPKGKTGLNMYRYVWVQSSMSLQRNKEPLSNAVFYQQDPPANLNRSFSFVSQIRSDGDSQHDGKLIAACDDR
ncbi:hypothetical protein P3T76_001786 [Phytophthora citrophthora]|uniref:Uncharacterized protein n=1 Tax=Phytophthora citrophthora TaxID=4793 RepID=A0AAD9GWU5_9STRA|nr:hypothetical protein P3T76_003215 [Phytophthora citrophthora]KAK1946233.1 hypothetical protein P3T76_001786 [Phytophthora citrophthora]